MSHVTLLRAPGQAIHGAQLPPRVACRSILGHLWKTIIATFCRAARYSAVRAGGSSYDPVDLTQRVNFPCCACQLFFLGTRQLTTNYLRCLTPTLVLDMRRAMYDRQRATLFAYLGHGSGESARNGTNLLDGLVHPASRLGRGYCNVPFVDSDSRSLWRG